MLTSIHGIISSSAGGIVGIAWDVSTATYASKSADISVEVLSPIGATISDDGTKLYVIGSADNVYQYTIDTAWDMSTSSYASKLKNVSDEETEPTAITFGDSGTKMYMIGGNDTVYQYTVSTAWDVSTATYASKFKLVSAESTTPYDVTFSSDGTKMYVLDGTIDTVFQYTLNTAWDLGGTVTYASKSVSVSAEADQPRGIAFGDSGTKMYATGFSSDAVSQYTLGTAWDVSTATYASKFKDISANVASAFSVMFRVDGTNMYVLDISSDRVHQYNL